MWATNVSNDKLQKMEHARKQGIHNGHRYQCATYGCADRVRNTKPIWMELSTSMQCARNTKSGTSSSFPTIKTHHPCHVSEKKSVMWVTYMIHIHDAIWHFIWRGYLFLIQCRKNQFWGQQCRPNSQTEA